MSAKSIEARLRAMQRKLSAIAEIPKILSSTLATVSQTFDKLMPMELIGTLNQHQGHHLKKVAGYEHRKCSYDEDAIDYELTAVLEESDEYENSESEEDHHANDDDDYEEENVYMDGDDVDNGNLGVKSFKSMLKDVTPESDYASEANYPENGMSEDEKSILDDDDSDDYVDDVEVNEYNKNKEEIIPDNDTASNSIDDGDDGSEDVDKDREEVQEKVLENDIVIEDEDDTTSDNDVVFYLKLPERVAAEFAAVSHDEVASHQNDEDYDELNTDNNDDDDDDEDEDFLSTTYTWNLRNTPKLRLNDAYDEMDLLLNAEPNTATQKPPQSNTDNCDNSNDNVNDEDKNDDDGVATLSTNDNDDDGVATLSTNDNDDDDSVAISKQHQMTHDDDFDNKQILAEAPQKVLFKLDSVERSWPWADRERIIYKQSTCHLVPRKPLGLIEKRIQLLAKQNLLEKLKAADAK